MRALLLSFMLFMYSLQAHAVVLADDFCQTCDIPEPSILALFGIGAAAYLIGRRKK